MVEGIILVIVFLLVEGAMTLITLVRGKGGVLEITLTAAVVTLCVWASMEMAGR